MSRKVTQRLAGIAVIWTQFGQNDEIAPQQPINVETKRMAGDRGRRFGEINNLLKRREERPVCTTQTPAAAVRTDANLIENSLQASQEHSKMHTITSP